ncbi:ATP-binding protein [Actinophytocola oryzae]|uniref:AAA ATPase-like protein n=1 Tax=Actinophytocola oryzae TaxID=502181 RepID=A0A4R7VRQ0_9PSEU|nr:ATP-binding protein [Actinophytocola oryzae]TDV52039.1 AAA ATPase-like protein [Actinophytocola oryzae]
MRGDRTTLPGRDAELSELDSALAGTTADRHTLVAVRGDPGVGKTTLLACAAGRWRRRGITVISVHLRDKLAPWDLFGAGAMLDALREHYTRAGDFSLAGPVDAAAALCTAGTYDSAAERSWLLARLAEVFDKVRTACPTVLIADDLDAVSHPTLAPARLPGYLIVAACQDTDGLEPDRVVDLQPVAGTRPLSGVGGERMLKIS